MDEEKNEKKERRGLFGAKLRERDNRTVMVLYTLGAVYLLYTSYQMIRDVVTGVSQGVQKTVYIISPIVFILASVYILFSVYRIWKITKAEEAEQAKLDAEAAGVEYEPETGSFSERMKKKYLIQKTEEQIKAESIANRARIYVNPAEETSAEEAAAEDAPEAEEE